MNDAASRPHGGRALLDAISGLSLLLVTGKGGVGKSTLTAVLGRCLAAAGRRTQLIEADARESLYPLLGVPPSGGDPVLVEPNLTVQIVRPRQVFDGLVAEKLRLDLLTKKVIESEIYKHFVDGAPGFKEVAVLGNAYTRTQETDVDIVVIDAPATGHGLSMLRAPSLVSEVIQDGPIGEMAAELAEFVDAPERCGALVVTHAEEMPVQETLELIDGMERDLDRKPVGLVVNGLYPEPTSSPAPPMIAERAAVNVREAARLDDAWDGPRIDLPLLPLPTGEVLVSELRRRFEA